MKKFILLLLAILTGLSLTACGGSDTPPSSSSRDPHNVAQDTAPQTTEQEQENASIASSQEGVTKTFQYDGLELEVSNVKEIKQGSLWDGMETWSYDIYVVYPGATVTILQADPFIDAENCLPHADWAFLTASGDRMDILDDMETLSVPQEGLSVYDPESSMVILEMKIE